MFKSCAIVMFLAASFMGCGGEIRAAASMDEAELHGVDSDTLLTAYNWKRQTSGEHERLRSEVERRGLLTSDEWNAVDHRQVKVGMREHAVILAWGEPGHTRTVTDRFGVGKVLVYRENTFVFLTNGVVTAIEN